MTGGRPRLPTPERRLRRLESKRAWAFRNTEQVKTLNAYYRARPEYKQQRKAYLASARQAKLATGWTPKPPGRARLFDREDEHLEHVRNLTRQRVRRHREKIKKSATEHIIPEIQVRSNDNEYIVGL